MSFEMVQRLVRKDWYFQRFVLVFYFGVGLLGLAMIRFLAWEGAFYMGSIFLIAALMGVGIHLIMATVVLERKEHNLPFVMSLPISAMDYTSAKVIANLTAFLLPWIGLVGTAVWMIRGTEGLPEGLIPFTVLILTEIALAYCVMLAVAIVSESEGWTILVVVVLNVCFNFFLFWVSHLPSIAETMTGPVAVWNRPALAILAGEVAAIAFVLAATFVLQARKRDFL